MTTDAEPDPLGLLGWQSKDKLEEVGSTIVLLVLQRMMDA